MQAPHLDPLLNPRSIVVVGASDNPLRIGGMAIDLMNRFHYEGNTYAVNPKYETIQGERCYRSVDDLPEAPDLAVIAVPAALVTRCVRECHARGIPSAIIYAAGFSESGTAEGQALQRDLEEMARDTGMAIAGPNCMGFANLNTKAYTAFARVFTAFPAQTERGVASVLTQSGNVCSVVFGLLRQHGVPVSHFINTGNEAVLEFSQYLQFLVRDEATECVLGYVEQLRDGERFIDAALAFAHARKPLVIFKAGETEKGAEAVRSHTSALAGDASLYRAAFEQLNVLAANDMAQMADIALLSRYRDRSAGRRLGIVTLSGALGAILADKFLGLGLDVPTLSAATQLELGRNLPDYGLVSNPIDCTGNIVNEPESAASILSSLARSPEVDVIVLYAMGPMLDRIVDVLLETVRQSNRLLVVIDTGGAQRKSELLAGGIPVFSDISRAVHALGPFCLWHARMPETMRWAELRRQVRQNESWGMPRQLNEFDAKRLLADFGVPAVPELCATDVEAAEAAAKQLGYPVALKLLSPDVAHKTELGGVRLNLSTSDDVRAAFNEVIQSARLKAPRARIDGVLIQRMVTGVSELIAGVTRDPVFGRALTVGLGGVLTEVYKDVSHRLLPVDARMAAAMLKALKSSILLQGFRGRPVGDVNSASQAIAALASAAQSAAAGVGDMEINPLVVLPDGACAVDAVILREISERTPA